MPVQAEPHGSAAAATAEVTAAAPLASAGAPVEGTTPNVQPPLQAGVGAAELTGDAATAGTATGTTADTEE
jgi:hypothetical protein